MERAKRDPRRPIGVRLGVTGYERVAQMADEETEGNVSQMLRKLLTEALRARETRGTR